MPLDKKFLGKSPKEKFDEKQPAAPAPFWRRRPLPEMPERLREEWLRKRREHKIWD